MKSPLKIIRQDRWLIASFPQTQKVVSWAVQGGGARETKDVVWYQVTAGELKPPVDPRDFIRRKLLEKELPNAVALLTSADLEAYSDVTKEEEGLSVRAIVTAGLNNALRVGDPPAKMISVGTINLLCAVSQPLTDEAYLEAMAIAVEARTAAVLDAKIPSLESGKPATGTGTDCIAIAAPAGISEISPIRYAGKHTLAGAFIGQVVYEAASSAIRRWKQKNTPPLD